MNSSRKPFQTGQSIIVVDDCAATNIATFTVFLVLLVDRFSLRLTDALMPKPTIIVQSPPIAAAKDEERSDLADDVIEASQEIPNELPKRTGGRHANSWPIWPEKETLKRYRDGPRYLGP